MQNIRIILILCLISTLGRFALDSYLPSFLAISQTFSITEAETQWTLTLYLLGFGVSQLFYGPLSDRYGRKKILLGSFVLFLIGNLLCAIATSITQLIFFRFISGLGGGASGVLNRAIAADHFKGPLFAKAWSYTTTSLVLTLIFAPVVGSTIQVYFGWRGNFVLMALLIAFAFLIVVKYMPESNKELNKDALKIPKVIHNYKTLITNKSFIFSLLCYIFAFSGLIVFFQISPFLFMKTLGLNPSTFARLSCIVAGSYLIGGLLVNRFSPRHGIKNTMLVGIILLIIGGLGMLSDIENISIPIILIPAIIFIIGARIVIPNATASAFTDFTSNKGSASALIGSLQMVGTAVISFVVSMMDSTNQLPLGIAFITLGIASFICFRFLFKRF